MFKLIVTITQTFDTVEQANDMYEELKGEVRKHTDLHINGQVVQKFTGYSPEHPQGHEVPA